MPQRKFVILAVLDGWGLASDSKSNAISQAQIPHIRSFLSAYPHTQLDASGQAVGLPRGEVGNTETGHLNLGAGRIVYQDLERINMSIADGSFFDNTVISSAFAHCDKHSSSLHLMGLLGAGGVHSNIEHLFAILHFAKQQSFSRPVYLHLFTDGRDSPPNAAKQYLTQVSSAIQKEGIGQIASVMGRYWAMDRDHRWERTAKAYFALTQGKGLIASTPEEAVDMSYAKNQSDEFIEPTLIVSKTDGSMGLIHDNDAVIFFNFRIDRPRQLTKAFLLPDFTKAGEAGFDPYLVDYAKKHVVDPQPDYAFDRGHLLSNLYFVTMTEYEKTIVEAGAHVAFPPEIVDFPLGRAISDASLRQLRVSESEKERFVTFYFNGLREHGFPGEDRMIIPSPHVATYDLKPEMSANEITDAILARLSEDTGYSFVLVNFANADMVGHTGNVAAAIKACETVDVCLGKLSTFLQSYGGVLLITADHGNVEEMIDQTTGTANTEHSANPVPFIAVAQEFLGKQRDLAPGILSDVAPTILHLLGMPVPTTMTGRNLLEGII